MSASPTPGLLDATASAFSPGQSAHPSPATSERFSSPSPPLSAVNFQSQFQFQPQQYFGPQKHYGYQPFPIFNGYTQAYEYQATPRPSSVQPQGAASWYPQQNGYVDYMVNPHEPFAEQFTELQGVRNGRIPGQNTWYHYGTGNYINNYNSNNNDDAPKKNAKKNRRKKFNRFNKEQDRAEEQKGESSTQAEPKLKIDARKQRVEQQDEPRNKTKAKTNVEPKTKATNIIRG